MNVRPVQADYFVQVAQFVWEVVRRRERAHAPTYSERLDEWATAMRARMLHTENVELFVRTQDALQVRLSGIVDEVRVWLADRGIVASAEERLGLAMWVRRPSDRSLVNWAASDRTWKDPDTLQPVPIHWGTPWASVDAFCHGAVVVTPMEHEHLTRWNHVLGTPVFLNDDARWGRLPVGVLTFTSTARSVDSVLHRLRGDGQRALGTFLSELGRDLYLP